MCGQCMRNEANTQMADAHTTHQSKITNKTNSEYGNCTRGTIAFRIHTAMQCCVIVQ